MCGTSEAYLREITQTRAGREQLHEKVKSAFEKKGGVMCATQFSAELSAVVNLSAFMNPAGSVHINFAITSVLHRGRELKSFSVLLCMFVFSPPRPSPLLQFQFIIRKSLLYRSLRLHSTEKYFNLHLSAVKVPYAFQRVAVVLLVFTPQSTPRFHISSTFKSGFNVLFFFDKMLAGARSCNFSNSAS